MKDKILVLGGTQFVGRQLVEELLMDSSKEVYLYNRGKTNPYIFSKAHKIIGDRNTDDVKILNNYKWDYVIDFSSYYPDSLINTLKYINRDVKKYIYISTISVYSLVDYDTDAEIDEDFQQMNYSDYNRSDRTMHTYGNRKAACEKVLYEAEWLTKVVLRPSIIYGKYDHTDRFYFWLKKIKEQHEIILQDAGKFKFSMTFADDLVRIIHAGLKGKLKNDVYNCSTHAPMTITEMMHEVKDVLQSDCRFVEVKNSDLDSVGVTLPITIDADIILDNSKLRKALSFDFKTFRESLYSTIKHYEEEGWRECAIQIDDELERKLMTRKFN